MKKSNADAEQGRQFAKLIWIPLYAPEKDGQHDVSIVSRVLTESLRASEYLPKNMVTAPDRKAWIDSLKAVKDKTVVPEGEKSTLTKALHRASSDA